MPKIDIAEQVCYLRFVDGKPHHSADLDYQSARGEMLVADFDADGRIIGIELVGPAGQKPFQSLTRSQVDEHRHAPELRRS